MTAWHRTTNSQEVQSPPSDTKQRIQVGGVRGTESPRSSCYRRIFTCSLKEGKKQLTSSRVFAASYIVSLNYVLATCNQQQAKGRWTYNQLREQDLFTTFSVQNAVSFLSSPSNPLVACAMESRFLSCEAHFNLPLRERRTSRHDSGRQKAWRVLRDDRHCVNFELGRSKAFYLAYCYSFSRL